MDDREVHAAATADGTAATGTAATTNGTAGAGAGTGDELRTRGVRGLPVESCVHAVYTGQSGKLPCQGGHDGMTYFIRESMLE